MKYQIKYELTGQYSRTLPNRHIRVVCFIYLQIYIVTIKQNLKKILNRFDTNQTFIFAKTFLSIIYRID